MLAARYVPGLGSGLLRLILGGGPPAAVRLHRAFLGRLSLGLGLVRQQRQRIDLLSVAVGSCGAGRGLAAAIGLRGFLFRCLMTNGLHNLFVRSLVTTVSLRDLLLGSLVTTVSLRDPVRRLVAPVRFDHFLVGRPVPAGLGGVLVDGLAMPVELCLVYRRLLHLVPIALQRMMLVRGPACLHLAMRCFDGTMIGPAMTAGRLVLLRR